MNHYDLAGHHAVITGGASGLGLATAQRMVASGARVTLWDRDEASMARAAQALGPGTACVQVDVADAHSVEQAAAATAADADILVNSAGITGPNVPLAQYPVDEWMKVMAVNINGVFLCSRAMTPRLVARGWGRIVNIASVAGKDGNPNASAYSTSKAAVIGMTKSLGKELASTGVRVNCITPAAVHTAIFDQMTPEHIQFMLSKIPMGRFGKTEEVAAMIAWLSSEDCSFSTGAVFDLSGGRSTY
ncbi:MAG: hypothetical protein RIQ38_546 [Pseudomonadota bacterium]|jgi:3-oxoacyl-[acyl-carrier protein] reductase